MHVENQTLSYRCYATLPLDITILISVGNHINHSTLNNLCIFLKVPIIVQNFFGNLDPKLGIDYFFKCLILFPLPLTRKHIQNWYILSIHKNIKND